jgi:uncharacterized protein YjdB/pimeloyl-ACP methyl ester carboxylesterase
MTSVARMGICLAAACLVGCANDLTRPSPSIDVAKLTVNPETASVAPLAKRQFIAAAVSAAGQPLNAPVVWSLSDSTLAAIAADGTLSGVRAGLVTVIARAGDAVATARANVLFPDADSAVTTQSTTVTIKVGLGSSVAIPGGTFPTGSRISVSDLPSQASSDAQILGTTMLLHTSQPSAAAVDIGRSLQNSTAQSASPILVHLLAPFDASTIDSARSRVLVTLTGSGTTANPTVLSPTSVTSATSALGDRLTDVAVSVSANLLSQTTAFNAAIFPVDCTGSSAPLLYRASDHSTGPSDPTKIPVIFVHGLQPTRMTCDAYSNWFPDQDDWAALIGKVTGRAALNAVYEPWVFRYASVQHIELSAQQMQTAVEKQILAGRVDRRPTRNDIVLVGHSMGGLVSGDFMIRDASNRVQQLVTLGTPWFGSELADQSADLSTLVCSAGIPITEDLISTATDVLTSFAGVGDLSTGSAFIRNTLSPAALAKLAGKVRTYSGDVSGGIDAAVFTDPTKSAATWELLSCLMSLRGAPINDGAVSGLSAAGVFGANTTVARYYHTLLIQDYSPPAPHNPQQEIPDLLAQLIPSLAPVATVTFPDGPYLLTVGSTATIPPIIKDIVGDVLNSRPTSYISSDPTVAPVTATGLLMGGKPGGATITATSEGKSGSFTVTVTSASLARIAVAPASTTVQSGSTLQLSVSGTDTQGNTAAVNSATWSTDNASIATVTQTGLLTGLAVGSAIIKATAGTLTAQSSVTVTPGPIASVTVSPSNAAIAVATTVQLTAIATDAHGNTAGTATPTWTSSNTTVATVSNVGLITGVAAGAVTVTAAIGNISGSAAISVNQVPVASVSVTPSIATIAVSGSTQLIASIFDQNNNQLVGRSVVWHSSDTTIATVNGTGLVSGKHSGMASITATSEGKVGTASISVTDPNAIASVSISPSTFHVQIQKTAALSATALNSAGAQVAGATFTWSSSATSKATVDNSGIVTGIATGSATITATSANVSGSATATIDASVPTVPTNVTATAVSASAIVVSWQDTSTNVTYYAVDESKANDQNFSTIDSNHIPGSPFGDYQGLQATTTYYYRVRACNANGCSPSSAEASDITFGNPVIAAISPSSPTHSSQNQTYSMTGRDFASDFTMTVFFPDSQGRLCTTCGSGPLSGNGQIQNVTRTAATIIMLLSGAGTYQLQVVNPDLTKSNLFPLVVR